MPRASQDDVLQQALEPFPRWRLFGHGTATARFDFSEAVYAAGFATRAIEQARAFARIPDLSLSGLTVKLALALSVTDQGLSEADRAMLEALERAADHPGRPGTTQYEILPVIGERWSPRSFTGEAVSMDILMRLFEAARWSSSCFNEQPWRYVVVTDPKRKEEVSQVLVEGNAWAREAPVMILVAAHKRFGRNKKANKHALYDTGAATSNLLTQATALGLVGHQMAGFDAKLAKELFNVPINHEPIAMMVLGYWGEGQGLDEDLLTREGAARERQDFSEWLFWEDWGQATEAPKTS